MNAFQNANLVEARGMAVLVPFLDEKSDGRLVLLQKGALARVLQGTHGDAILQMPEGRAWSVEIKCEEDDRFGNLFLETWSNRNLEDRERHIAHGSNPGWMAKLRSDLLLYYFLAPDRLYIFDLFRLQQWAFGGGGKVSRIFAFPERAQGKRAQLNDTWGRCVPLSVLRAEVGYRLVHPKQLPLFDDGNPFRGEAAA